MKLKFDYFEYDSKYGGLNMNGPHRPVSFDYLKGIAVLEGIWHWEWALGFQRSMPSSLFPSQPVDQGVAFSYCSSTVYATMFSCHCDNGLNP